MRSFNVAVAVAVLGLAGAARADSPIPGNYVDDFGRDAPPGVAVHQEDAAVSRGSAIAANYVDDFGSLVPAAQRDEPGAASGEPGREAPTMTVRRGGEQAAVDAYHRDRFVREVWSTP